MLRQVFRIALLTSLFLWALVFTYRIWELDSVFRESAWYYYKASAVSLTQDKVSVDSQFWARVSHTKYSSAQVDLTTEKVTWVTEPYLNALLEKSQEYAWQAANISLWSFGIILGFFVLRGGGSKRKEHVSGRRLAGVRTLALKLKLSGKASDIRLGKLPLVKGTETQHLLISGGTGSGKSNCFHHILPQVRRRGERAIVVDATGDFLARYYREGKDIILNPFDARRAPWHPWVECRDPFDYDSLAESFIPPSNCERESYWRNSARSVFSAVLQQAKETKRTSAMAELLLCSSLKTLCKAVEGTKAEAHLDISSEKTAASIRSVASSYLEPLEYLQDTTNPFSIREWVENENDDSWLFLTTKTSQRTALRPLISAWLSIAIRGLIQLDPDLDRRLWFVIDELPSLQKLKDFDLFLAEGRKYGGCALLAIQSPAQLEAIYGWEMTKVIVGNCLTRVAFYEQDPEIADKLSKIFGEREVIEQQEGISYGAHQMRDGVNLSSQLRHRPVVSANDLQSLEKHEAFVKLPGKWPISKIKLPLMLRSKT